MNDIERMIAAIVRPGPSRSLDERVQTLLAPEPIRPRKSRWRVAMAWLGTAACVGLVGFYVGRVSVSGQPISAPVATVAPPSDSPSKSCAVAGNDCEHSARRRTARCAFRAIQP